MTRLGRNTFIASWSGMLLAQQFPQIDEKEKPKRLPDGTLQSEAILKEEHKRLLADLARLQDLGREIETELNKNDHHVLSMSILKKLEEVEKLARRMRGRHNR